MAGWGQPARSRAADRRPRARPGRAVLRALATLEGTLSLLTPGIDIAAEARQYAADHVAAALSPAAVPKSVAEEVGALLPVLRRLPRRFDRVTGAMEQGRLSLNVRLF